jgi:hypothetical protein
MIARKKLGRNESCPCGSGLKYKRCCLLSGKSSLGQDTGSFKRLQLKMQREFPDARYRYDHDLPSEHKLSQRIFDIANRIASIYGMEVSKAILEVVIIAWNIAVCDVPDGGKSPSDLLPKEFRSDFNEVMSVVVKMKNDMYPDDFRFIVGFDISEGIDGLTFNVASSVSKMKMPANRLNHRVDSTVPEHRS